MHSTLESLFRPNSIAIVGASDDPTKIGGRPVHYLLQSGFAGSIFPVNPKYSTIQGIRAYPNLDSLPGPVDLLIIAVPARMVMEQLRLGERAGVHGIVIFSAGFTETGERGKAIQQEISHFAKRTGIRILGPNCLGVLNTRLRSYCTFTACFDSGGFLPEGRIGIVTQSGAFGSHVFTLARNRGIGVSCWAATGNEVDVDVADCIDYLAGDPDTDVIAVYLEGCRDGPKLLRALDMTRNCGKPVVMLKVGRSREGAKAVASHTASLVGDDFVYEVVFREKGLYRADGIEEFLNTAYALSFQDRSENNRVAVLTMSGGVGILLADHLVDRNMRLPEPSSKTQEELKKILSYCAPHNPVDVTAQIVNEPGLMGEFMEKILGTGQYDMAICFLAHLGASSVLVDRMLEPMSRAKKRFPGIPVLVCTLTTSETKKKFEDAGFMVFEDPVQTVKAAEALAKIGMFRLEARSMKPEVAQSDRFGPLPETANGVYTEYEAKRILSRYGIPTTGEFLVFDPEEAVDAARRLGYPVVLKGMSPDVVHKTDAGLVALGLRNEEDVRSTYMRMAEAIRQMPGVRFAGVLVQQMLPPGLEMIVGARRDPVFGPVVMTGFGGIYTELIRAVSARLAPVTQEIGRHMIGELKGSEIFLGARGRPELDVDALAEVIARTSQLICDYPEIEELDVNPVLVYEKGRGATVCDAVIKCLR